MVRSGPTLTGPDQRNRNHLLAVPMDRQVETATGGRDPAPTRELTGQRRVSWWEPGPGPGGGQAILGLLIGHTETMGSDAGVPFTYAEIRPYAVAESLDELRGPVHGALELPHELAWSGRRRFDLDDDYDRAAAYKIILEEGREEHFRRYLNAQLLQRYWQEILPARQVGALWEARFPQLRRAG